MRTLARAGDKAELLRRLRTVRPDSSARWGRMNAHQMICHLADSCRMAMGEKAVSAAGGVLERTAIKWIALYSPLRFPPGVATRPEIDPLCDGTRPGVFARDVDDAAALLDRLAATSLAWPRHPIFGRMSRRDWMRWAYLHTDHHLRQFGI